MTKQLLTELELEFKVGDLVTFKPWSNEKGIQAKVQKAR